MQRMVKLRRAVQVSTVGTVGLALTLSISCVRSEPSAPTNAVAAASSKQELPFHPDNQQTLAKNLGQLAVSSDPKLANGLPFRSSPHRHIVPSGTLLTVQLAGSLSSAGVHAGDKFAATLAAPLTIDGEVLLPRGTAVSGQVESAEALPDQPESGPGSGCFRLALSSITVEGRPIPLQTSSLFILGTNRQPHLIPSARVSGPSSGGIRVQNSRRPLTFRLIAPVVLADPDPTADRPSRAAE